MAGPAQSLAVRTLVARERLWNGAGIGDVRLDDEGAPTAIRQLDAGGGGTIFKQRAKDD